MKLQQHMMVNMDDLPQSVSSDEPNSSREKGRSAPNGSFPPTLARLVRVAGGLSEWTPEEQAWLARNPKWINYARRLQQELAGNRHPDEAKPLKPSELSDDASADQNEPPGEHSKRARERRRRLDPPSPK